MRAIHSAMLDKRRPVLVLTRAHALDRLNSVTVAPITTRARGLRTEVAVGPAGGRCHSVVKLPDFCSAVVTPENPFAVNGIVPVGLFREVGTKFIAELPSAIIAVAYVLSTQSSPTVVGEPIRA